MPWVKRSQAKFTVSSRCQTATTSPVKRVRIAIIVLLLLVAVPSGVWIGHGVWLEQSQDVLIRAAAQRYGLEPALVKAVVWRESGFRPEVRGHAGEVGLMQLRYDAAAEWAGAEQCTNFDLETCLDPRTNTLAGTFYLAKLMKRYTRTDNPVPYALADYNAGRGNVLKWNTGEAATNSAVFITQIGFPGTSNYVLSVMERAEHYRPIFK
jgi:soluble lytic murein transglycosylase